MVFIFYLGQDWGLFKICLPGEKNVRTLRGQQKVSRAPRKELCVKGYLSGVDTDSDCNDPERRNPREN